MQHSAKLAFQWVLLEMKTRQTKNTAIPPFFLRPPLNFLHIKPHPYDTLYTNVRAILPVALVLEPATDRLTDGQTDRPTDRQTEPNLIAPSGALAPVGGY